MSRLRRIAPDWLAGALVLVALAACQSGAPTVTPRASSGSAASTQSLEAPITFGPPPSPTPPDETTPVVLDPTLLEILPADVSGNAIEESPEEATQAMADASLPRIATAMDAGVAVDSGNGDLVVAWVVRLRHDEFSDPIYQQWRDSYDEGACQAAGGILGNAEAQIDARTVYITSCVQGLRTYHVWLKDKGILISASAIGADKFGEVLVDNLRVPE